MTESLMLTVPSPSELAEWNATFSATTPEALLAWASDRWGSNLALSCSFGGAAGMVLLDMVSRVAPLTSIVYVDTGLLFPETYALVETIQRRYGITPQAIRPRHSVAEQARHEGPELWNTSPDRCCNLRKVQPLAEALAPYDSWITGIRRGTTAARAKTALLEWSTKYNLVKLNPLALWTDQQVWSYVTANDVPYHPLLDQGYPSIGCFPCTQRPTSDDPRSGRWAGSGKTECGLHLEPA